MFGREHKQWSHKVAEPEGGSGNSAPYDITKGVEQHALSITFWKVD